MPLYEELGTEMFSHLDAEFALVLYDAARNSWIAARDPIGIRPLFYGYDREGAILFASEAKNLEGLTDESRCDAITGATLTSDGVNNMLHDCLSRYMTFLTTNE